MLFRFQEKFGSNYNLNLFEFNTRTILEISNGYICLSGFVLDGFNT
jgi:hypothetical protein